MDDLFFWIIILGAVSVIGSIVWWALVFFGVFKVAQAANRHFEAQLQKALQLGKQLENLPPKQRADINAQMADLLSHVGSQWQQLDHLSRQKHDVQMGELMGYAASNGLDWTPPS